MEDAGESWGKFVLSLKGMVKILGAFPAWAYVHSSYVVVTKIGDVLY